MDFRLRFLEREDFIAVCRDGVQGDASRRVRRCQRFVGAVRKCVSFNGRGLRFVRLLARANEAFDCFARFSALSLLEFIHPGADRSHHIGRRFTRRITLRLGAWLSLSALSSLDYFDFFL